MDALSTAKALMERKSYDLEALCRTMGERLAPSGEKGRLQFRIHDRSGNTDWVISLGDGGPKLEQSKVDQPHLGILTQKETMLQMAEGTLTPTVAFCRGQMRVRGDVELGKRLLIHLGSRMAKCGNLLVKSADPDPSPHGCTESNHGGTIDGEHYWDRHPSIQ